jgi:hypothetical protein
MAKKGHTVSLETRVKISNALVGKKFKWVSNLQIRVINNDGIEKTVDIENECD